MPLFRIGEGEQLLELVDGEQEGGVVLLAAAQPVREPSAICFQPSMTWSLRRSASPSNAARNSAGTVARTSAAARAAALRSRS